jgi:seryl-tRNA synthetase
MHDVRAIRADPQAYDHGWSRRGATAAAAQVVELDEARREQQTRLQQAQARRNEVSGLIGRAKSAGDSAAAAGLLGEVEGLKGAIAEATAAEAVISEQLNSLLASLPNLPDAEVPEGLDETCNLEVRRWGETWLGQDIADHVDLGERLGMMDFDAAARMSGARFVA